MSNHPSSNVGERFISKGAKAFKLTLPKPEGGYFYRSVGFVRLGEEAALKKAIAVRNEQGVILWGKFWSHILNDEKSLCYLPRTFEPEYCISTDTVSQGYEYRVNWMEWIDGKRVKVARRYSCEKHGKLTAYLLAKRAFEEAHKDVMDLLRFMERASPVRLK